MSRIANSGVTLYGASSQRHPAAHAHAHLGEPRSRRLVDVLEDEHVLGLADVVHPPCAHQDHTGRCRRHRSQPVTVRSGGGLLDWAATGGGRHAMEFSGVGIWSFELRYGDAAAIRDAVAELESLGYTALWVPGGIGGAVFEDCENILGATEHVPVATGILNLWMHSIQETCDGHARVDRRAPDRFLLGIGVSHAALVDGQEPGRYASRSPSRGRSSTRSTRRHRPCP